MSFIDRRYGVTGGVAFKAPCRVATTANITLSGLQVIDGVTVAQDDRVLVKDQTDGAFNGIWNADSGSWTRAVDFDGPRDCVEGTLVAVSDGTSNNETIWQLTTSSPVIGTSSLQFSIVIGASVDSAGTIAALKAFVARPAAVVVQGKLTAGDGGGGTFAWFEGDTTTADDAIVVNPTVGEAGRYKRIFSGPVNAKWFGVVGDGTTVDTAALQAAIDSLGSKGGTVLLPSQCKAVVGNITIKANVRLLGEIAGLDATSDNITFNFDDLGSAIYTQAGTTITLQKGATIERCLLSPTGIKGAAQSTTSSFAGTALTVGGLGAAIIGNIILGYATAVSSTNYSRIRVEWNAIDAQSAIDVQGTYDSTRINNNQCWPYLTHGAFWNSGANYAARDKTKLYRTGSGLKLTNGADDTQVDGNLFYGFLVGIEMQNAGAANFGRNWIDHPSGVARASNYGAWFRANVTDVLVQTLYVWGCNSGVVLDMNNTEKVVFDLVHTEVIDGTGFIHNSGDFYIGVLKAETCGGFALSIGNNASDVTVDRYSFKAITGAEPISLAVASCTTALVKIGDGYWDGAAGGFLIGTNAMTFPTVASADPLLLPVNGKTFFVSGTTNFGAISGGWAGRRVTLIFTGILTVSDGAIVNITANFTTSANDVLEIEYDGTQWLEVGRAAN